MSLARLVSQSHLPTLCRHFNRCNVIRLYGSKRPPQLLELDASSALSPFEAKKRGRRERSLKRLRCPIHVRRIPDQFPPNRIRFLRSTRGDNKGGRRKERREFVYTSKLSKLCEYILRERRNNYYCSQTWLNTRGEQGEQIRCVSRLERDVAN